MHPTKRTQKRSHPGPHPFGCIGMDFANPVTIIVACPFLDGMTDGGMGSLELAIALRFISIDLSIGVGELMNMPTKDGSCRIGDNAQPHLPALSPNCPDDWGTIIGIGSPSTPFVGPPSWRVRWITVFITFFPPRSETSHRFRSRDPVRPLLVATPARWLVRLCGSHVPSRE